jgi:hypothetical protein
MSTTFCTSNRSRLVFSGNLGVNFVAFVAVLRGCGLTLWLAKGPLHI